MLKFNGENRRPKAILTEFFFNIKCVGVAFTILYILGARGKIYANVTIDVAFAIFLCRKFPFCCYCSNSEKKFANKVCCFKAVQNIEIHINSI